MARLTLAVARPLLWRYCSQVGPNSSDVPSAINVLTQWLVNSGKWNGTLQRVVFQVTDDQITLPRNLLTILGAGIQGIGNRYLCKWKYPVRNEWYEFIPGGPGLVVNAPWDVTGFDSQGDGFVLFRNLPSAGKIKIYSTTTEASSLGVVVKGYSGGQKVYTGTGTNRIEGELIGIPTSPGASTSGTTFDSGNSIYMVIKPITNGVVNIFHVDPITSFETQIASYDPGEQIPCYRRYFVPKRCNDEGQVVAYCKIRHYDVVAENDEIIPGNVNALEIGLQALNYRRKNDMGRADQFFQMCLNDLNNEIGEESAEQSWGTMQIDPVIGLGMSSGVEGVL